VIASENDKFIMCNVGLTEFQHIKKLCKIRNDGIMINGGEKGCGTKQPWIILWQSVGNFVGYKWNKTRVQDEDAYSFGAIRV
jgi:hypothetical protein